MFSGGCNFATVFIVSHCLIDWPSGNTKRSEHTQTWDSREEGGREGGKRGEVGRREGGGRGRKGTTVK